MQTAGICQSSRLLKYGRRENYMQKITINGSSVLKLFCFYFLTFDEELKESILKRKYWQAQVFSDKCYFQFKLNICAITLCLHTMTTYLKHTSTVLYLQVNIQIKRLNEDSSNSLILILIPCLA